MRTVVAAFVSLAALSGGASAQGIGVGIRVEKQPPPPGVDRAEVRYGCWVVAFGPAGGPYAMDAVAESKSEALDLATKLAVSDRLSDEDREALEVLVYGFVSHGAQIDAQQVALYAEYAAEITRLHDDINRDRETVISMFAGLPPDATKTVNGVMASSTNIGRR